MEISDFAIKKVAAKFPSYKFKCFDVTEQKIQGEYDMIMMVLNFLHYRKKIRENMGYLI